jgi:hypothetical protein
METKGLAGFEDDLNLYLDNLLTLSCHVVHKRHITRANDPTSRVTQTSLSRSELA